MAERQPPQAKQPQQQSRTGDNAPQPSLQSPALREGSSKSTPSNRPSTDASSVPPKTASATPRTPFTPTTQSPVPTSSSTPAQFRVPASPRDNTSASTSAMPSASGEPSAKQAKVAIPRLKRTLDAGESGNKASGRHRVTHACEPCRHRKTKCSGERPTCRHCQDFKIDCYYADGKRDRVKKEYRGMQEKVTEYERVLQQLSTRVSDADADLIHATLDRGTMSVDDDILIEGATIPSVEVETNAESSGAESDVSGGRGSTGALDRTEEDFTREGAKVTGFMGKNSDVTWMQRLRQENKYGEGTQADTPNAARLAQISGPSFRAHGLKLPTDIPLLPEADQGFTIQDSSYHLNDLAISTYEAVDAYEMPTQEHAHILFTTYMTRVHPSFPILGRLNLQNQFLKFLARPTSKPPAKWLAIVNLIFAISAKYSHLIRADWEADDRDHLIYFTRARMLSVDAETIFNHPDLQMIQIIGLMSYYLLAVNQINRSWNLAGMAIRAATGLGLNMRNDSGELQDGLKEIRYRVWWSLYTLEHRLCSMTGRVNCIADNHCTTPLPVPLAEEEFESELGKKLLSKEHQRTNRAPSSNPHTPSIAESLSSSRSGSNRNDTPKSPSTTAAHTAHGELDWTKDVTPNSAFYFLHLVQLCRLTQQVFQMLYVPTTIEGKWSDVQRQIGELNEKLENWYRKLPAAFDFRKNQRNRDFYEARISLGFHYYGTKQMLHRPCLCRLDRKIPGQSNKSNDFNHTAATTCVVSAQELLNLIPDEPNAVGLLRVGPWVTILHSLVQAATVLMLEISFRAHHMPEQADDLIESAKKVIRWLHALGDENLAAARAWRLCRQMLNEAADKIGRSVDGLPERPPRAASVSDDASMSSATTVPQPPFNLPHTAAFAPTNMTFSTAPMPDLTAFASNSGFDPYSTYDQYYPSSGGGVVNPSHMQYSQRPQQMRYDAVPTDAEMSFINQYTEQHEDRPSSRPQGGRSGFG